METSILQYELDDLEQGKNLKKFQDDVKKEMKKQEKPKTKPSEIFEGFKEKKNKKKVKKNNPRFSKQKFVPNKGGTY
tara:strand:+ start:132 stop:362 length:231 start_codon:yes stop_codon:yes gene_type:complete